MRNKLLLLTMAVGVLIIFAAGYATNAWFSSSVLSRDNTFKTGTLKITGPESSVTSGVVDISNIYPGWGMDKNIVVQNSGTMDFYYRMYIQKEDTDENPLYNGASPLKIKISRGEAAIRDYTDIDEFGFLELGSIKAGELDSFFIYLKLPETADDSCQGKSLGLSFVFEARQQEEGLAQPGNVVDASTTAQLEAALSNSSVSAINLLPGTYALEKGVPRPSGAGSAMIFCNSGKAVIVIIKDDARGYGSRPVNVVGGNDVKIYENALGAGYGKKYTSIQSAINAASDNGVVYVWPGLYGEKIKIDRPLVLLGAQAHCQAFTRSGDAVEVRQKLSQESVIMYTGGDIAALSGRGTSGVTVKGFRFEKAGGSSIWAAEDLKDIVIENNLFINNKGEGVRFKGLGRSNILIQGNAFYCWTGDDITAVSLSGGRNENVVVNNNFIQSTTSLTPVRKSRGISLDAGVNVSVSDNVVKKMDGFGIGFIGGSNVVCSSNTVVNTLFGIQVLSSGISELAGFRIRDNTLAGIRGIAVYISRDGTTGASPGSISDVSIEGNTISQNISEMNGECGAIWASLDNRYTGLHGVIKIASNNINFLGSSSTVKSFYGIVLMGKVNKANLLYNSLNSEGVLKAGIYIKKDDSSFGTIPADAVIDISDNIFSGFETDVWDTR